MSQESCYHCGDEVIGKGINYDDKSFCCNGCKSVYQLLSSNELGSFYDLESQAGTKPSNANEHKYAFLDVESIRNKFIDYEDDKHAHITLFLPQIHCSSCIYLLENFTKIEPRVQSCQVNFTKRQATLVIKKELSISELANILDKIGYAPNFGSQKEHEKKQNNKYLFKLGVAGFAFGSIMLWSFPEYLGLEDTDANFRNFTSYLSFFVSIPVLLYSANEYLISAYKALRYKSLNLDVPISIGIMALYLQSCYNIFSGLGPGYMDSFAGFVFFLLIGKWFQNKTYRSLSFERDYTAYFPVAVTRINKNNEEIVEIDEIKIDESILIRNQEVIPCDSILQSDSAKIDYSFVTGEAIPVEKVKGDFIFAGGKLLGKQTIFKVQKESNRSHLTQLWNDNSTKEKSNDEPDKLSVYFLAAVILIALISGIIWYFIDSSRITEIVVSILIVACPCALALSKPFTHGNIMRLLGRKGLYLKNTSIIEEINKTTDVVFDKTGTLTTGSTDKVTFEGEQLSQESINKIIVLANSSTHPLSRSIVLFLKELATSSDFELLEFNESSGEGITGIINDEEVKIGAATYVHHNAIKLENETSSHVSINNKYIGRFVFESEFRIGISNLLNELDKSYKVHILSGDKDRDKQYLIDNNPTLENVHFNQSPKDKLDYIQSLENKGANVMMIGDGLNDSGALETATTGIAISEDVFRFTPSSDAIIEASKLVKLITYLNTAKYAKTVLRICYSFSIIYNIVGLTFAISGNLTPL
ncbi:MAG: heavy metal translocating P-type ATPase, partial [Crocinitomicaceae bacterium]